MKARNTIDEILTVVQAAKDGKQIQYWYSQYGLRADDGSWQDCAHAFAFDFADHIYRVKPGVKKVPLTQADIPLDRPVWISRESDADTDLVVCVRFDSIRTWYTRYSFHDLFVESYKISFDGGKTWQPCEKEVAE